MHPSISQRRAILEGLRERARLATAEFYQKPSTTAPALTPGFIVKPSGNNTFEVIERATGKFITERFGHNNATSHARELEAKAVQFSIKQFGKYLRSWTLRIGALLAVFAFFGSDL